MRRSGLRFAAENAKVSCMADVLALVTDMIFQAKILETARQLGVSVRVAASGVEFERALASDAPPLAIVDLNAGDGALAAIKRLRAAGRDVRVVAFCSHVQTELARRARDAGADEVLPRSRFSKELGEILSARKT
jgi:DNA-binding NarL/FixJ family response regulator